MLTYKLEKKNGLPLYESLYRQIKDDILGGRLKAGEKLPSKRQLAEHLHISRVTVENAYSQLMAEGYLYSVEKSGYFVDKVIGNSDPIPYSKNPTPFHTPQTEKAPFIADFTGNSIPPEGFPFSVWSRLMRNVMLDFGNELLLPTSYGGAKILREAIADYLADSKQLSVSPDQIVVGAGTEYLYGMLIRLLGYNKVYGVEDPGYHKIRRVYHSSHVICRSIRLDKDGVPPQELEAANIDILHFSPSHHFPTGMVTPVSRRLQLLDYVTQQKGRYIIEDDYDSEFRFVGKPIPPMQSLDSQGKVIYMNTFSKTLAPSIRISYIVLPPELATEYQEKLGFYSCTVPSFEQYTLARFINQGYLERHIYRMRKHYREIRNLCLDSLKNSKLQKYISVSEEDAGLHFLLRIHTQKSDAEICSQLKRAGIRVSALSEYYATPPEEPTHTLVINYSGADEKSIHTALERLERIFL